MKMNKKVLAIAMAVMVAAGSSALYASNDDNNSAKTEQCGNKKDCKKDRKDCKDRGEGRRGRHDGHRKGCDLFNGVQLTADQQAAIKKYRDNSEAARREAVKKEREDFMNELKSVLTPEQYQQVEQNAAQFKADKANKAGDRKDGRQARHDRRGDNRNGDRQYRSQKS